MCAFPFYLFFSRQDDPNLHQRRRDIVIEAARALDDARMIRFQERTMLMSPTDLVC